MIGTRAAATAIPDGYTLVMSTSGTTSINPSLYANPGYDTLKDFTPIGLVASTPIVVMAHPSFRATSISELIAMSVIATMFMTMTVMSVPVIMVVVPVAMIVSMVMPVVVWWMRWCGRPRLGPST